MKNDKFLDEVFNSINKSNTMTPLWSYSTLLNKINALNYKEENHISHYSPKDLEAGLGRTASGLPIKHFCLGTGRKHIVVIGGECGNDIIHSQAIYYLMGYLSKIVTTENLADLLSQYCFDFIPVLNPEGYIITTSAINYYIKKYTNNKFDIDSIDFSKATNLFKQYAECYAKSSDEALTPIHNSLYSYQELFSGIDESSISNEFQGVKHQINILHQAYNMPYEAMGNFVSNGNGVDLGANRNNPKKLSDINKANSQEQCLYNNNEAFRNIPISYPSSKGCPSKGKDNSGKIVFEFENENLALLNFAKDIEQKNGTIELIMSLHSNNKLLKVNHYIEYEETKANPCGIFTDSENILNTYLKFIDSFTTTFENLVQNNITITTKKDH